MRAAEPTVPISAIEHHEYCPRQCALIHSDGVWAENRHTIAGTRFHRRADSGEQKVERGRTVVRSVPLWSTALGLSGRSDAIEVWDDGRIVPVEYKSGVRHGIAADLQLCAQAICLEEMLDVDIPIGFLWFGGNRRRAEVKLDGQLRSLVGEAVNQIRDSLNSGRLPRAVNDERCEHCQLLSYCLPGVVSVDQRQLVTKVRSELFRCDS